MRTIQLLLCIPLLTLVFACQSSDQETKAPNIVIILADDLGYGDISIFNEKGKITTPYVDKLAKEGVMFTDAHTSSSLCTPTRYSIVTGR
ncbi:MAG: sulfatase-like hydrolase/transferase, partial [Bacteroidales bacterium]